MLLLILLLLLIFPVQYGGILFRVLTLLLLLFVNNVLFVDPGVVNNVLLVDPDVDVDNGNGELLLVLLK